MLTEYREGSSTSSEEVVTRTSRVWSKPMPSGSVSTTVTLPIVARLLFTNKR
jgi:hypothetical protein